MKTILVGREFPNIFSMRIALPVLVAVLVVLVTVGAIGWVGCERGIHPERDPQVYHLSRFNLPGLEKVHFKSRDGLRLAGWFVRGTNGATIVLAHGRGGDKTWRLPHAEFLHRDGFGEGR